MEQPRKPPPPKHAPTSPPSRPPARRASPSEHSSLEDSRQAIALPTPSSSAALEDVETPVTTPRDSDLVEQKVRLAERALKKEHHKATLALEERFEKALAEKNSQIQMLQDMLENVSEVSEDVRRSSSRAISTGSVLHDAIPVEASVGFGLPESVILGATLTSDGPIVSGSVKVEPLGTIHEMDRIFNNPFEVRSFFREHFPWGSLDQPWRAGKRAYLELMDALSSGKHRFVHMHMRLVAVARISLSKEDARFNDGFSDLLEALQTAGRPSDFDLFMLDCGGPEVVSQVVAGGGVFLLTFPADSVEPGESERKPWQLARVGARRFQMIVCAASEHRKGKNAEEEPSTSESRMLKCPIPELEGALSVLLKMHVNLTAFPGQARYTQVPLRSKVFGRVAAVEGAAEFLVEHGWVDDGNKIVFQGSSQDVDNAVAALEIMIQKVARKKERSCTGLVILEGGTYHGSCHTWDDWRATHTTLYHSWITTINHRARMLPLKVGFRELHKFLASDHPLKARLRATVQKGIVHAPAVTDVLFVCADDLGADLVLRLPHGYVPVLRQVRDDRSPIGQIEDLASLVAPPREKGHRQEMVLCYKSASVAARLPISGLRMANEADISKGDEVVRCVCGAGAPRFAGLNLMAARTRFEGKAVRSIAAVKPLLSSLPKGYEIVYKDQDGEVIEFNFADSASEALHLAVKIV